MVLRPNAKYSIFFFLSLFLVSFILVGHLSVRAETSQQIAQEKSQKQQELNKIMSEISTISSSSSSIASKLNSLKKEKGKLEKLLGEMGADLMVLENEAAAQERELVTIANTYSLQQALYSVESQKNFLLTLFESANLSNMLEKLLYYNVQAQAMNTQREFIALKKEGIDAKRLFISQEQASIQKSLSTVTQQIATLEDQQTQIQASLAKSNSQKNLLVSDISKLTSAEKAILAKKAAAIKPPSGSGGGGGSSPAPAPNTSGSISLLVGGVLVKKTDAILKMSASSDEITLKGIQTTEFSGTLEFNKSSGVYAINSLPMDKYLWGLAEMPSSWSSEALKAQAIAGRSYAAYKVRYGGYGKFDLYDSVQDQEYNGLSKIKQSYGSQWKNAVDTTSMKTLEQGGKTIQAIYSSDSGGHTLSSEESPSFGGYRTYLQAKPDRYLDGLVWRSYGYNVSGSRSYWKQQSNVNTMALLIKYLDRAYGSSITAKVGTIQNVEQYYNSGGKDIVENSRYTASLKIIGSKGEVSVSGTAFKTAYNVLSPGNNSIWSNLYDIKKVNSENWELWSRGWGHRVGMSQYGAQGRALAGQTSEQILKYYYTNANVVQYDIGRNVRVALTKVGSRVMKVTAKSEISIYEGSTLIKTVPANTEIRVEYN